MLTKSEFAFDCIQKAWIWIQLKYNIIGSMPNIQLSNTCHFAKYIYNTRTIRIDMRRLFWTTYMKKRIGLWAPLIYCTLGESITLQAIHELTHHIQHDQNRKYSEVETTLNEIEYAKEYYPGLYRKLEKIN